VNEAERRPPEAAGAPLEDRERTVLAELSREMDAWVTFQGLRRQLGVHQQALARTLRRLEDQGLVQHDGKGYQLTDRGAALLRGQPLPAQGQAFTVLEALLPPHLTAEDVAASLSRRWFGGLRWYAQSEAAGEVALHWVPETGKGRVTVRVQGAALTLEVQGDAASPASYAALRPVMAALAELYGLMPQARDGLATFALGAGFSA
jgi:biotin operon repressor